MYYFCLEICPIVDIMGITFILFSGKLARRRREARGKIFKILKKSEK